jgi:hypothetical protein
MPRPPSNPENPFDAAQQLLGNGINDTGSFVANEVPSQSGFGTRQSRIKNNRPAINSRNMMHWLVPEQPIVQMYINPQNVTYSYKKSISSTRTKGGFLLQYWGEDLTTLRLTGTTGTSGIEGINVLEDVYRSEQLAMDPYALFLAAQQDQASIINLGSSIGNAIGGDVGSAIGSVAAGFLQSASDNSGNPNGTRSVPSLAELAFTVELYWSGEVYRGFFQSFTVTESSDRLGLFNYDIEYVVTQKRGFRQNFLGWHRSATSGPSNSDSQFGTPHSFGTLVGGDQPTPQRSSRDDSGILQSIENSLDDIF